MQLSGSEKRRSTRQRKSEPIFWRLLGRTRYVSAWLLESSDSGLAFAWRGALIPSPGALIQVRRDADADDFPVMPQRAIVRHRNLANIVFCDGHVSALSLDYLFTDSSDDALKIWNRDNEPHRERLR